MIFGSLQDPTQHKGNLHSLDMDNVLLINVKLFTIPEKYSTQRRGLDKTEMEIGSIVFFIR